MTEEPPRRRRPATAELRRTRRRYVRRSGFEHTVRIVLSIAALMVAAAIMLAALAFAVSAWRVLFG